MEKVWKAEQREKHEKERIAQLLREREEERQKEEIQQIAISSGHGKKADRLEWMYAGPVCLAVCVVVTVYGTYLCSCATSKKTYIYV